MSAARIDTAVIIAVGSELLTPHRVDTNSLFLTSRLNELAIEVQRKVVVGDDRARLAQELDRGLADADLVVLTGGLGPTDDDLTRDALSAAVGAPLVEQREVVESIRARFEARRMAMPEINLRQAFVPRGAEILANPRGTAPGLWLAWRDRVVVALPGPPRELEPMVDGPVRARLATRVAGHRLARRVVVVGGRAESYVEERVQPVYARWRERTPVVAATILAAPGQIELHLSTRAPEPPEAEAALDLAVADLEAALGRDVYSTLGESLELVVGERLRQREWRLALAESCTGGLVASRLTDVPGSSAFLDLAVVAYANTAKTDLLGVAPALLETHGAVSEPVALAMASGVAARAAADVGLGVTGIAGPTGGSEAKPVGTVCIAVTGQAGERVRTFAFRGERTFVKRQASQAALDMLRRMLDDRG
ncbi:MAG: competence/damage-inducible protein A [Vicinamibacterales bacterium]|jgi:nicotinamide-nucleotide amidase|nr:competence/damage-inducible protein A [Vicinamibacterales bacterium]MDP7472734.1 competence/damage-inducible protein A [Vicinamibacterales bacterium]MDP7671384.1 competence/damage-inducible protein A [Vicinamibacterales bacterium]HJO39253.1 competence/damage-inducible protein A [Vicinamibacterales bacterium]